MKIDIFCHVIPVKYKDSLLSKNPNAFAKHYKGTRITPLEGAPALADWDIRFRIMDRYPDYVQVLSIGAPSVETVLSPEDAAEVARVANDELVELVMKYPHRFVGAIACLPMNDIDAALKEADRAIQHLKFRGVQINTSINGKPLDSPEFMPLYEKMVNYDLPIWIHPVREASIPDYPTENESKYQVARVFGWPYETAITMHRLVFSGVLDKYPKLKIITHHAGGILPYLTGRARSHFDYLQVRLRHDYPVNLIRKPLIEYYRMFYADTAVHGTTSALMCAYELFGADHVLFGTDMPYDSELGNRCIREGINAVEQMDISDLEKKKIFEDNARSLLRLSI